VTRFRDLRPRRAALRLVPVAPRQGWLRLCLAVAAAGVALLTAPRPLTAQQTDRARTEALSRRVDTRVRALQAEADRLAGQTKTLLGELRQLEVERDLQVARATTAEADARRASATLAATEARLTTLERQRVTELPNLHAGLVELYKQGRGGYARMLFNAQSLREMGRTARGVAALARLNRERAEAHRRTLEALRQERLTAERTHQDLAAAEAEARRSRTAAERAVAARAALVTETDRRRDLNAQLVGELQMAQQKLAETVANLRAGRATDAVTLPIGPFRGALDWPVAGRVTARFGAPVTAAAGEARGASTDAPAGDTPAAGAQPPAIAGTEAGTGVATRSGIDIAAAEGARVRAVHRGTVSYADAFEGFGTLVIVDHGAGAVSLYGYLGTALVARDQHVEAGDPLGTVGLAPTGPPALYFELRVDGRPVNPVQWLQSR